MTIREEALELSKAARGAYYRADSGSVEERLTEIIERLAELVAACAPEFKEAP